MIDLVGFGVALATGIQFLENFPERFYKSALIPILIEDKRAGEKLINFCWIYFLLRHLLFCMTFLDLFSGESTGKGFYVYDNKRKASPDPELSKYIEKSRNYAGVTADLEVSIIILLSGG